MAINNRITNEHLKRILYLALYTLLERWQLIMIPVILVPIAVFYIMVSTEKYYQNHASILIEENVLLSPYLSDENHSYAIKKRIEALKTLVLGRQSLYKIIKQQQLVKDINDQHQIESMQECISEAVSIELIGSELVRIDLTWHNKQQMKPLLDAIVNQFIAKLVNPTQYSVESSESLINQQLSRVRSDFEQARDALAQFTKTHEDELTHRLHIDPNLLTDLNAEKQKKQVILSGAKAHLLSLKSQLLQLNPINSRLQDDIVHLQDEIAILRKRYTDSHSKVQAKLIELKAVNERNTDLRKLSDNLDAEEMKTLWQMANTSPDNQLTPNGSVLTSHLIALKDAENTVVKTQHEIDTLTKQISDTLKGLSSSTQIDKTLSQLEKDYQVKQTLYGEMLEKYEISRITKEVAKSESPNKVRTIERAFSPTRAINLPLFVQLIIAIGFGLLTAASCIFILMLMDNRIRDSHTIEIITGKPIVCMLPKL